MAAYLKSYSFRLLFLIYFTLAGTVLSPAVMSIGVIAIAVNILLESIIRPSFIKQIIPNFIHQKQLFSLSLIFFTVLLSLAHSKDFFTGLHYCTNKIPFLIIPLAISQLRFISKHLFFYLLSFFIAIVILSSIPVMYIYIDSFKQTHLSILKGQSLWVPFNHIRYSTLVVFAFFSSLYIVYSFSYKILRIIFASISIGLFIYIHILAVRSGLLSLYIGLVITYIYYTYQSKNKLKKSILFIILILSPIAAYHYTPSLKHKINYTLHDWKQFGSKNMINYSDSKRVISYRIGIEMIKDYFPWGVGTGSIKTAIRPYYNQYYPHIKTKNQICPHNQFMFSLIDAGLLGLLGLLSGLFYALFSLKKNTLSLFYMLFWIVFCSPLLFDLSLESQLGITSFCLWASIILKRLYSPFPS